MRISILILVASALLAACGGDVRAEPEIGRFSQSGNGAVNTFWIETDKGVVVVDTQRQKSTAKPAIAEIEAIGKPVTHIIITHAHPDHYGGFDAFREAFPEAQVVMDRQTQRDLDADIYDFSAMSVEFFGNDFSPELQAGRFVTDGETAELNGLEVRFEIIEDTEAGQNLMVVLPEYEIVLASDLVTYRMHPLFETADVENWKAALLEMRQDYAGYKLYPGHGEAGNAETLIDWQLGYLDEIAALAKETVVDDGNLSDDELASAVQRLNAMEMFDVTGRPDIHEVNIRALLGKAE